MDAICIFIIFGDLCKKLLWNHVFETVWQKSVNRFPPHFDLLKFGMVVSVRKIVSMLSDTIIGLVERNKVIGD